jgi:N12 class adenine-specific DNA methylase
MPPEALLLFDLDALNTHGVTIESATTPDAIIEALTPIGHRLSADGRKLASGWKARALDNLAAIRLADEIAKTPGRVATPAEMEILARYVGFGATELAQSLFPLPGDPVRAGWEDIARELHALVDEPARALMARSTQYAHYTPDALSRAMWDAVTGFGFAGGRVLEPGCGIGLFIAAAPETLAADLTWVAVEMDPTTAKIAAALHPTARVLNEDFTKTRLRTPVDLAIGNPPFSATRMVGEGHAGRMSLRMHDYFIARAMELVRPGGFGAFITSHGTMDKVDAKARRYMGSLAQLLGAVRLPQGAMAVEAGTEVVVDMLFFRRLESGEAGNLSAWEDLVEVEPSAGPGEGPMLVNRYFAEHPEMVLGAHAWVTSPFGPRYSCASPRAATIDTDVRAAISSLTGRPSGPVVSPVAATASALTTTTLPTGGALFAMPSPASSTSAASPVTTPRKALLGLTAAEREMDAEAYRLKEGSYTVDRTGKLLQMVDRYLEPVAVKTSRSAPGIYPKADRTIKAFIAIRNALRAVIVAQSEDQPYADAQARLLKAYNAFVAEFGPINLTNTTYTTDAAGVERPTHRRPNLAPVLDDPDCWLVASIEKHDPETNAAEPGPIFTERVVRPPAEPEIDGPNDALAASLDTLGRVDVDYIAALLDVDREMAIAQLDERIYCDPARPSDWITADEYLSGAVRVKLAQAETAAADDARYERNVVALRAAQPADLNPSDVTARLGSPWIPPPDIEQFVDETMDIETQIGHTIGIAAWDVNLYPFESRPSATSEWGTGRRHAGHLLHDALNGAVPHVYDYDPIDKSRTLNPIETEAAREKLEKIKNAFTEWIWKDTDRTTRLMRIYNDTYNDIVPRAFDGSHLRLRGAAANVNLYPHQKRVVWRIIASGTTYIAHSVGAGKTMSIAAAVMEERRLGLVTKPLLTVPGHCLAQFSREWLQMYPTAKILVADEQNFAKEKRDRFVARATTGDWDCIIITHSAFTFIPSPTEFEKQMIEEQVSALESMIGELKKTGGNDRTSRKRLEQRKEALRIRYEALRGRKDDMVTIAEMGIDQIIVDEAQNFRKLSFTTNAGTIKGIDSDGSQRAWDLYVKSKYVETRRPTRALVLASGTPITNTLGEMFTIQRYMGEIELHQRGIHEFDAWKACFGETVTELELQPSGSYKPVTRFAEFINVPELVAMFRSFADVVQRKDLRDLITLPQIATGGRQVITAEATASFKAYQKALGHRIAAIEARHGKAQPGDDIILSVITDGRHAAVDIRFVDRGAENEETNKLNALIRNVFRIWRETSDIVYTERDGAISPTPGAGQMIFSDIGTVEVGKTRGFSAYEWIRDQLIAMGVPAREIAFMQDYKRSAEKQALFNAFNAGRIRVLIGSSETMGTGVNVQKRLKALHHLDVPWLPSQIEQREGRIERQGNENDVIEIYAYATPGSMDAPMWQTNERKARFIGMAMSGDKSIRRLEDAASAANSFAVAKAIASGNPLLMQKAGLEADIGRLRRLRSAHFDDQHALRNAVAYAKEAIAAYTEAITSLTADLARAKPTKGDAFAMNVFGIDTTERTTAGAYLLGHCTTLPEKGDVVVGSVGGFDVVGRTKTDFISGKPEYEYGVRLSDRTLWTGSILAEQSPVGIVQRLENAVKSIPKLIDDATAGVATAERRIRDAGPRLGLDFEHGAELDAKLAELAEIENQLLEESRAAEAARRAETSAGSDDNPDGPGEGEDSVSTLAA